MWVSAGMRSGTAGTGQPRAASPAEHGGSSGTAGATRFTAVSSQRVNEGGADSRVTAAEQNHISMAQGGQPEAPRRNGASRPPPGQGASAKQSPGAMRFTSRPADPARTVERGARSGPGRLRKREVLHKPPPRHRLEGRSCRHSDCGRRFSRRYCGNRFRSVPA